MFSSSSYLLYLGTPLRTYHHAYCRSDTRPDPYELSDLVHQQKPQTTFLFDMLYLHHNIYMLTFITTFTCHSILTKNVEPSESSGYVAPITLRHKEEPPPPPMPPKQNKTKQRQRQNNQEKSQDCVESYPVTGN